MSTESEAVHDVECAVELIAARINNDEGTMVEIIERNPDTGGGLLAVACALTVMAADAFKVPVAVLLDELLLAIARKAVEADDES
jgi:hypothetical protein